MSADEALHVPVLRNEVVEALAPLAGAVVVDCTFGRGGHARALLDRLGDDGRLLALDRDPAAVECAQRLAKEEPRMIVRHASFGRIADVVESCGLRCPVDRILFDLGVSSPQLDDPARGFSFLRDGPLDMRMDPSSGQSAADWLAEADAVEIAQVLFEFGEERHARRIARALVAARETAPIRTTRALASIVAGSAGRGGRGDKHPATRTFQAIRIFVNRELEEVRGALEQVPGLLAPGGRLAVISFHSLEDRIVKRFIRRETRGEVHPRGLPVRGAGAPGRLRAIGRAVRAGPDEIRANPRARSAVMRVAERLS